MDNETFGIIVVTVIVLLFLLGIGSILLSFFFDNKPYIKYYKTKKQFSTTKTPDYSNLLDDIENNVSVIFDDDPKDTFDLNIQDIE